MRSLEPSLTNIILLSLEILPAPIRLSSLAFRRLDVSGRTSSLVVAGDDDIEYVIHPLIFLQTSRDFQRLADAYQHIEEGFYVRFRSLQ